MTTLLLSNGLQPEADELAAVAERAAWAVQWMACDRATELPGDELAFYGDTVVGGRLASSARLALLEPTFDLLTHIPRRYTKRRIEYATLADARRAARPAFVKSADACHKFLPPRVWEDGAKLPSPDGTSPDAPVLISEPVTWLVEYRAIVLERQAVTFSPYMRRGVRVNMAGEACPHDDGEVDELLSGCRELLSDPAVSIPPAVTLDFGLIEDRGWAVVEFNPVWCSRLYTCDRARVLPALRHACRERELLSETDRRWVLRPPR